MTYNKYEAKIELNYAKSLVRCWLTNVRYTVYVNKLYITKKNKIVKNVVFER